MAYAWLNLAAAQEFDSAAESLAVLKVQMTSEQISEAQKISRELWDEINKDAVE